MNILNTKKILSESVVVGLLIVVIGSCVSYIFSNITKSDLPPVCKDWNKNYIMEMCLFLTGFLTHIVCEFTGINKWYCTQYLI